MSACTFSAEMMLKIGERLRSLREAQDRTLDDISLATRINRKFIESIERGIVPDLPATYVRAFIDDYSRELGVDSSDVVGEFEQSSPENNISGNSTPYSSAGVGNPAQAFRFLKPASLKKSQTHQFKILLVLTVVVAAGLTVSILLLRGEKPPEQAKEIAFSDVIREEEQKQLLQSPAVGDKKDTLRLEGIASDTVWVKVAIDNGRAEEYIFPPFFRMQWKAKNSFLISLGDASAISFTLNGQKLGTLSPVRQTMQNIALNWETLERYKDNLP